jgi:glucan biosynthesis protein C
MNSVNEPPTRLYYLDWLRVLAMLGVFFYHNARLFDGFSDWHVKNATTNAAASIFRAVVEFWGMPLFFLLAGAGTYFALKIIKPWQYVQERALRLLVPLIFGMLILAAPQAYYEAVHGGALIEGNVFQIYVQYLKTLPDMNWYHFWFLEHLFIFSIITLPIFIPLGRTNESVISRLAAKFQKPWALLMLVVLSFAVNAFVYPEGFLGAHVWSGWNIINNLLFFIVGYMVQANERIIEMIRKTGWFALILGVAAIAYLFTFIDELSSPTDYYGSMAYILAQLVQSVNTWAWIIAILSLGIKFLNGNSRFLKYANEAVLPFYMLHQTVIIVIGFYVVQWSSGVGIKYLVVSSTSFIIIMAIYELLIRRFNIVRFLFGMRPKRKPPIPVELPELAA